MTPPELTICLCALLKDYIAECCETPAKMLDNVDTLIWLTNRIDTCK